MFKTGHDQKHLHTFQLIIHSHPTIRLYITYLVAKASLNIAKNYLAKYRDC
jgi:hypothetical protein